MKKNIFVILAVLSFFVLLISGCIIVPEETDSETVTETVYGRGWIAEIEISQTPDEFQVSNYPPDLFQSIQAVEETKTAFAQMLFYENLLRAGR